MINNKSILLLSACALMTTGATRLVAITTPVVITVLDGASETRAPCRIYLSDAQGQPVQPTGYSFWKDHFVCDGRAEFTLSAGDYSYELDRGPEYYLATGKLTVQANQPISVTHRLQRLTELTNEGWWSGETHIHRPAADIELLMRAADLHVGGVQTWWNNANLWANQSLPTHPVTRFDGNRFYDLMSGEDERGGGALLYFGLEKPLEIAGSQREFPAAATFLQEAKKAGQGWVDIEKPFWWDTPIWLASGFVDSVGIAHNHLHRNGVLENEAWGKSRDREEYPPPHGNALWTQDIYYHMLNCGLRIAPSAGSASGVLPNPVGYNRAYVHVDGGLTYEKWWKNLKAGRVFVSNGPLLRSRANGELPGHVFKNEGPLEIELEGQINSRDPIAAVELVKDGQVERIQLPTTLTFENSGWFLVRAVAEVKHTFRFASTGPWYVEIGGQSHKARRESAQFFLDWVRERKAKVVAALPDETQQGEALKAVVMAEEFWQAKVAQSKHTATLTGEVLDAKSGQIIPSRLYIQHADGRWFFPESNAPQGSAIRYEKQNWINKNSVEMHTTLSAHPFHIELPPGRYTFTAERGKEYYPLVQTVEVRDEPMHLQFPLRRWINMAAHGWYSGDTHVHRTLAELPQVMLAEDLNVAFPLTYWVTKAFAPPTQGDKNTDPGAAPRLIQVDKTHVIWPRNTEYEIFTVNGKQHTLGAVFALGHQTPFEFGAPPVTQIAGQAKLEGALLDLDKHNWPWSMALVPLMGIDLYELANNHMWRAEFAFTNFSLPAPAYMEFTDSTHHSAERDWILYTLQNYYALVNCGFRLRPTAGTANGVHPVPLGYGRVYAHLPGGFSYESWMKRFNEGRSFITTGPMMRIKMDQQLPGFKFKAAPGKTRSVRIEGIVSSEQALESIEIIVNGRVAETLLPQPAKTPEGAFEYRLKTRADLKGSGWMAARCWEPRGNGRVRFAHTSPSYFDIPDQPQRPGRQEAAFLIKRVRDEIQRSREALPPEAIAEYEKALQVFEAIAAEAR